MIAFGWYFSWVKQNPQSMMLEALLTRENIDCFKSITCSQSHVSGSDFLQALIPPFTHKMHSNALLEVTNNRSQVRDDSSIVSRQSEGLESAKESIQTLVHVVVLVLQELMIVLELLN